jgi:hypothetical protein
LTALKAIDYAQTMKIADNPDKWYERNPILGRHPSGQEVTTYFAVSYLATTAIAVALPAPYRAWWQYAVIGVSGACVANNLSIGIGFGF